MRLVPAKPAESDLEHSYNVAPTHDSPIVRHVDDIEGTTARWGLIPPWAKDASIASMTINARAKTADSKPAYRDAFASRRCVVPISRFYEWALADHGGKQPYSIHRADGAVLLLAGLWERWRDPSRPEDAGPLETFTILTVAANPFIAGLHDRMPAVLEPEQARRWIEPGDPDRSLLGPADDGVLDMHPVSTAVNKPSRNDPSLIEPIELDRGLFS